MEEIKQLVEELNQAFMEHKEKNDQRLNEIQKKGYADPVLEEQVDRVAKEIQNLTEVKERVKGGVNLYQRGKVKVYHSG